MFEWHIQSRSHECQHCREPFKDKQPYHTLLFDERHGFSRLDVCVACWGRGFAAILDGRTAKQMSQWQGTYIAPPAVAPDPIQKENAESLLRKLLLLQNPDHLPSCYILAAMLERKRILKVKEQLKEGGRRVFLYEHSKTGDVFPIIDPDLQLNQLEAVQHAVATLLERGIEDPGADRSPDSTAVNAAASQESLKLETPPSPTEC